MAADVNLGSVSISARFLTGRFRKDVDRANDAMKLHQKNMKVWKRAFKQTGDTASRSFTGMARAAGGLAAIGAAYGGALSQAIAFGREVQLNADRVKLATDRFQAYVGAFALLGAEADDVRDGLSDISEAISELAATGAGPLEDFSHVLGTGLQRSLRDATTQAERLELVFGRLREVDASQIQIIANRLTDSTFGQFLVQYVREAKGGIAEVEAEFKRRGFILPAGVAQSAARLGGELTLLQGIIRNDLITVLTAHTDALQGFLQGIEDTLPEFTARLYGAAQVLEHHLGTLTGLAPHALAAAGAVAPGTLIGRTTGELTVARQRAELSVLSRAAQVTNADVVRIRQEADALVLALQKGEVGLRQAVETRSRLERQTAQYADKQRLALAALDAQNAQIAKTTGFWARAGRNAVGIAGAFTALELAALGLSYVFSKLTEVSPADLQADAFNIAKQIETAITDGSKASVQALTNRLHAVISLEERLTRQRLEDAAAERQAAERLIADPRDNSGRRVGGNRRANLLRNAEQTIADARAEAAAADERRKALGELLTTYPKVAKEQEHGLDLSERRKAALQAVLPLLSDETQQYHRQLGIRKRLDEAVALGAVTTAQATEALRRMTADLDRQNTALSLNTSGLLNNIQARQGIANDLARQQADIDRQRQDIAQGGVFGFSPGDRAAREIQAQQDRQLAELERERQDILAQQAALFAAQRQTGQDLAVDDLLGLSDRQGDVEARIAEFHLQADAYDRLKESARGLEEEQHVLGAQQELMGAFTTGLSDALATAVVDVDNLGEAFKRLGVSILSIVANKAITAFFEGYGGQTGFGGVGGFFRSFAGGKQYGGNVFAGQSALVGENGPEIITAARSLRVTPIDRANGLVGGVSYNPTITVNAQGLSPSEASRMIQSAQRQLIADLSSSARMNRRTQENIGQR